MPGSWPAHELPNLNDQNCQVTSPATARYNCIAWAVAETFRWWWPDPMNIGYWPPTIRREETVAAFIQAYSTRGFRLCFDGTREEGVEKVALYGVGAPGHETPTHAALQLENGEWTSKLGPFEDITHSLPDDVNGPVYGHVVCFLSRPR